MNLLINKLPNKYKNIKLKTDFRAWIKFELILQDRDLTDEDKFFKIIETVVKDFKDIEKIILNEKEIQEFFNYIMWFYSPDFKKNKRQEEIKEENKDNKKTMIYSFEYDADYIYSSFFECYKIDLTTVKMHWWKFKALLIGLSEDCIFSKILGYRSMKIDSKMSKEEKKFYTDKKRKYALPDLRSQEEKESDFANSLFNMM